MKVQFLSRFVAEKVDRRVWRMERRFAVLVDDLTFVVPRGFVTDFASVPRLPLVYMLAGGCGEKAATLHDWLYAQKMDRLFADQAFRAALVAEGEPSWRAKLMYGGVRLGGQSRYDDHAPATVVPGPWPEGVAF